MSNILFIINWQFVLVMIYVLGAIEYIQVLILVEINCVKILKDTFIEQNIQQRKWNRKIPVLCIRTEIV
jgi:hypothetical protein